MANDPQVENHCSKKFFFVSSDIRAERLWITSRFAQAFLIVASLTSYFRAMLRLLGGFVWLNLEITSNLWLIQTLGFTWHYMQGRNKGAQFPGRQMAAGCAEKSQQCHRYFLQYSTFASEKPVSNIGAANLLLAPGAI